MKEPNRERNSNYGSNIQNPSYFRNVFHGPQITFKSYWSFANKNQKNSIQNISPQTTQNPRISTENNFPNLDISQTSEIKVFDVESNIENAQDIKTNDRIIAIPTSTYHRMLFNWENL